MIKLKEKCGDISTIKYSAYHRVPYPYRSQLKLFAFVESNICDNYLRVISRESFQQNILYFA